MFSPSSSPANESPSFVLSGDSGRRKKKEKKKKKMSGGKKGKGEIR